MYATFERFEIRMTRAQALGASHQGRCDEDVAALLAVPAIARQLDLIRPELIRRELREYGAWDETELADDAMNRERIVWLAAGNIHDEIDERKTYPERFTDEAGGTGRTFKS